MGNVVVFESFNGGKQADERVLELFGAADVQFGFAALENFAVGDFIDESQIARFSGSQVTMPNSTSFIRLRHSMDLT